MSTYDAFMLVFTAITFVILLIKLMIYIVDTFYKKK